MRDEGRQPAKEIELLFFRPALEAQVSKPGRRGGGSCSRRDL